MNNKTRQFEDKLSLEVNGVDYIIHSIGTLKETTKRATGEVRRLCPVSVKFYTEENGELIDLSGAARSNSQYGSGTNEEIRKILGTFDDFILTSLSLQNNGQNFIDKKQAERKNLARLQQKIFLMFLLNGHQEQVKNLKLLVMPRKC